MSLPVSEQANVGVKLLHWTYMMAHAATPRNHLMKSMKSASLLVMIVDYVRHQCIVLEGRQKESGVDCLPLMTAQVPQMHSEKSMTADGSPSALELLARHQFELAVMASRQQPNVCTPTPISMKHHQIYIPIQTSQSRGYIAVQTNCSVLDV